MPQPATPPGSRSPLPRVAIICTGADHIKRGYEMYARDLFEVLRQDPRLDVHLLKGSGRRAPHERVIFNFGRDSLPNRLACKLVGDRWKYYVEYATFAAGLVPLLTADRFDVFYVLEAPLYKFLWNWRAKFHRHFQLVHFTGGQLRQLPAGPDDYLHHVTPAFAAEAAEYGFATENQFLIPHFLPAHAERARDLQADARELRARLGIPAGRRVVLSVGHIDRGVKRMHHVVEEVARLEDRPFLLLVGQQDAESEEIRRLAREKLGEGNFRIDQAAPGDMWQFYAAADLFVLASLREGFGLVFLEALAFGLPVVAHDTAVMRYVLQQHADFVDMEKPGALAAALTQRLAEPRAPDAAAERQRYVFDRFGVDVLREEYTTMLRDIVGRRRQLATR